MKRLVTEIVLGIGLVASGVLGYSYYDSLQDLEKEHEQAQTQLEFEQKNVKNLKVVNQKVNEQLEAKQTELNKTKKVVNELKEDNNKLVKEKEALSIKKIAVENELEAEKARKK
jgi:septal ring factor EnvC (AmiA/AmiB activator)